MNSKIDRVLEGNFKQEPTLNMTFQSGIASQRGGTGPSPFMMKRLTAASNYANNVMGGQGSSEEYD